MVTLSLLLAKSLARETLISWSELLGVAVLEALVVAETLWLSWFLERIP